MPLTVPPHRAVVAPLDVTHAQPGVNAHAGVVRLAVHQLQPPVVQRQH